MLSAPIFIYPRIFQAREKTPVVACRSCLSIGTSQAITLWTSSTGSPDRSRSVEPTSACLLRSELPPPPAPAHPPRRADTGERQDAAVMLSRSSVRGFTSEVTSMSAMGPIPEG